MISLHNHSTYCDGKNSLKEMTTSAVHKKITHFGLSGHAPIPFEAEWSIKNMSTAKEYGHEIDVLKKQTPNINIYKGLEIDYIPGISRSFNNFRKELALDYVIGSVHLVKNAGGIWFIDGPREGYDRGLEKHYHNDFNAAMIQYYHQLIEMIHQESFEILAHCDKVLMNDMDRHIKNTDPKHLKLLKETLKLASKKNIWVEINTRGLYKGIHNDFYPGTYIFPFIKKEKIRIIYSADGHSIDQITKGYAEFEKAVEEYGIQHLVVKQEEVEEKLA